MSKCRVVGCCGRRRTITSRLQGTMIAMRSVMRLEYNNCVFGLIVVISCKRAHHNSMTPTHFHIVPGIIRGRMEGVILTMLPTRHKHCPIAYRHVHYNQHSTPKDNASSKARSNHSSIAVRQQLISVMRRIKYDVHCRRLHDNERRAWDVNTNRPAGRLPLPRQYAVLTFPKRVLCDAREVCRHCYWLLASAKNTHSLINIASFLHLCPPFLCFMLHSSFSLRAVCERSLRNSSVNS